MFDQNSLYISIKYSDQQFLPEVFGKFSFLRWIFLAKLFAKDIFIPQNVIPFSAIYNFWRWCGISLMLYHSWNQLSSFFFVKGSRFDFSHKKGGFGKVEVLSIEREATTYFHAFLMVKSKLPPRSVSVALRQLNPIHEKGS